MSDNWVVQNLENALETWNEKLAEIWQLLTQSPENFKGGTIWNVIKTIRGQFRKPLPGEPLSHRTLRDSGIWCSVPVTKKMVSPHRVAPFF